MALTNLFQRRRGLSRLPATVPLPAAPNRSYASLPLVGPPPDVRSRAFFTWTDRLIAQCLANVPSDRTTTYHFALSGNDSTGDGTAGNPWQTLAKGVAAANALGAPACLDYASGTYRESGSVSLTNPHTTLRCSSGRATFTRFTRGYTGGWANQPSVSGLNGAANFPGPGGSGAFTTPYFTGPYRATGFSVGGWVRTADDTHLNNLFDDRSADGSATGWHFGIGIDGVFNDLQVYVDGAGVVAHAALSKLTWHHVLFTFDGAATWKLYLDGALAATGTAAMPSNAGHVPTENCLGWLDGVGYDLYGLLSEWSFWGGRVLALADVQALYNAGAGLTYANYPAGLLTNLVANWGLGDAADGVRLDATGNGHNWADLNANVGRTDGPITLTVVTPDLWKRAEAVAVGWVKEAGDDTAPFRQIYKQEADAAHCGQFPHSWYWDGATLFLNPGAGVNPNTNGVTYEACPADGGEFKINEADGCRLENVTLLGFGVNPADTGATYGFQFSALNAAGAVWECVLVNVESYYTGYHAIGSSGDNARLTLVACRAGLCSLHGDITTYVGYAPTGYHELVMKDCEVSYGALPSYRWGAVPGKTGGSNGIFAHTNGAANPGLILAINTAYPANPWQTSGGTLIYAGNVDNTLANVRGYIVNERPAAPSAAAVPGFQAYCVHVNCVYDFGAVTPNPYLWPNPGVSGWAINSTAKADATARTSGWAVIGNQSGGSTIHWYNCHFDARVAGAGASFFDATAAPAAGTTLQNSVVSFTDGSGSPRGLDGLGTVTNVGLSHNAYCFGVASGYAADPAPVVLAARPAPGVRPARGAPLYGAGVLTTPALEYDQLKAPRRPDRADVGPVAGW